MPRLSPFSLLTRPYTFLGRLQSSSRFVSRGITVSTRVGSDNQEKASSARGVENVLNRAASGTLPSRPTILDEFSLQGRVGIVSGGNQGIGLELSLALCELGARIYVLDIAKSPSEDFVTVAKHVASLGENRAPEYISADVTAQSDIWAKVEEGVITLLRLIDPFNGANFVLVGDKEGRMDVCVAAAGESKQAS